MWEHNILRQQKECTSVVLLKHLSEVIVAKLWLLLLARCSLVPRPWWWFWLVRGRCLLKSPGYELYLGTCSTAEIKHKGKYVYGMWYVVYGMWYMVYAIWYMVCGIWYMSHLPSGRFGFCSFPCRGFFGGFESATLMTRLLTVLWSCLRMAVAAPA
jgi:hypothetical protein